MDVLVIIIGLFINIGVMALVCHLMHGRRIEVLEHFLLAERLEEQFSVTTPDETIEEQNTHNETLTSDLLLKEIKEKKFNKDKGGYWRLVIVLIILALLAVIIFQ